MSEINSILYEIGKSEKQDSVYPFEHFILLHISYPILFSFRKVDTLYLCYVLKYKRNKKISAVISKTNYQELLEIATQKRSIYDGINGGDITYIRGKLGEQNTLKETMISKKRISNFLPRNDYYLEETIPNRADLIYLKKVFKNNLLFSNEFTKRIIDMYKEIITINKANEPTTQLYDYFVKGRFQGDGNPTKSQNEYLNESVAIEPFRGTFYKFMKEKDDYSYEIV